MNALIKTLLLSLLTLTALFSQTLNQSNVKKMIHQMNKAASAKDIPTLTSYLHDDIIITIHVTLSGKTQTMHVNKAQYIQLSKQGLQQVTYYKHDVSNIKINIEKNKAFVSMDVTEIIEINGKRQTGKSKEKMTIMPIYNTLVVTALEAYTSL